MTRQALVTRREPGQVIALAAILMVAMVGMLALVVDAGIFIVTRHELQKAVDAGAVAAMIELAPDPTNGPCPSLADPACVAGTNQAKALASATDLTLRNLSVAQTLCTVSPPTFLPPAPEYPSPRFGSYTLDVSQGGGVVYTVTVTVRCSAGYTFGRILDLIDMPISATGTAAIGSVRSSDCPFPIAVQSLGPGDPGYDATKPQNFGWGYGNFVRMSILPASNNKANATSICLSNNNCGADDIRDWIARNPCVPIGTGSQNLREMGGQANTPIGPVKDGFRMRQAQEIPGVPSNTPGNYMDCLEPAYPVSPKWAPSAAAPSATTAAVHPQQTIGWPGRTGPVIASSPDPKIDWTILRASPCLAAFPVLDPGTIANLNGSGPVTVKGFALFYVLYFDKGNPGCPGPEACLGGYFVRPALNGQLGLYNPEGQPIWRPIR